MLALKNLVTYHTHRSFGSIMTPRRWIHRFTKPLCNSNEGRLGCSDGAGVFVGLKMNEARVVIESEAGLTKSDHMIYVEM
jgi:hypothetical protein